jgi:DNA-binding phage protein
MALKLRKWDVVEHLKTDEDIALYLGACLEEAGDDAAFIAKARGDIMRRRLASADFLGAIDLPAVPPSAEDKTT